MKQTTTVGKLRSTLGNALSLATFLGVVSGCSHGGSSEAVAQSLNQALAPGSSLSPTQLSLTVAKSACAANLAQDNFNVKNIDSAPVLLSDITIKYWVVDTSGSAVLPHVWYGGCVASANGVCGHQVSGVTSSAATFAACGPDAAHQANWEITVSTTDSTPLPPGSSWAGVQTAIDLASHANFNPGSATWYSGCASGKPYQSDPHFAVYSKGKLVFSSGISAPDCRAPHGAQPVSYALPPPAPIVGPVAPSTVVKLALGLPPRDLPGLKTFAAQVSDPSHPNYRQFLTPQQITAQFGPTAASYQQLTAWAQANNLSISQTWSNQLVLDVSGTAADVQRALYLNLNVGLRPDGSQFYALDRSPSLDAAVTVQTVDGLDNFLQVQKLGGSGPGGGYTSADLRKAYVPCTGRTGSGQAVGIFAFDGYKQSDIDTFKANYGLNVKVVPILLDGATNTQALSVPETVANIELSMAMAPGLREVDVFIGNYSAGCTKATTDILTAMASTNAPSPASLALQLSSSFGPCINATGQAILSGMTAAGQSFLQASGDCGGTHTQQAGTSDITLVGGTALSTTGPAGAWSSEAIYAYSGGGVEAGTTLPSWQNVLVPLANAQNGISTQARNDPDLALTASNLAVNATGNGTFTNFEGTSASAPLFAGFLALANEQNAVNGLPSIGFANPLIYSIGASAAGVSSFHDIVGGSSTQGPGCGTGFSYNATASFDLVTGWGSPQCALIDQLACVKCGGSTCVALESDPNNCGTCGHQCSDCQQGQCTLLASDLVAPRGIVVDSSNVYWVNSGVSLTAGSVTGSGVMKVALGGGTVTTLAADGSRDLGIAVNSNGVFWTADVPPAGGTNGPEGRVNRVDLSGGAITALSVIPLTKPEALAIDGTFAYWTDSNGGVVMKVPLAGGSAITLASGLDGPTGLAVDNTNVYFTNVGRNCASCGSVMRVALGGGVPVNLAVNQPSPTGIALDATNVYFTTATAQGTVLKFPKAAGTIVTIATNQDTPTGIAVDASGVYWTNATGNGTVMRLKSGGSPTVFAANQSAPQQIALDSGYVYWTNGGGINPNGTGTGEVRKLPK